MIFIDEGECHMGGSCVGKRSTRRMATLGIEERHGWEPKKRLRQVPSASCNHLDDNVPAMLIGPQTTRKKERMLQVGMMDIIQLTSRAMLLVTFSQSNV